MKQKIQAEYIFFFLIQRLFWIDQPCSRKNLHISNILSLANWFKVVPMSNVDSKGIESI